MNYAFGILPTIIRQDGRVSDFACRLFSEVDSLSNKYGYCFATNKALGKALSKSTATISRTLAELEAFNYVNIVIEDGYKRKIYPKRDFREFEGVVEIEQGGSQKCVGGYSDLSRGVVKNDMTANKNNLIRKSIKKTEQVVELHSTAPFLDEDDIESIEQQIFDSKADQERKKKVAPKKKESDSTPIRPMFELYSDKYAELNNGIKPEFMVKYTPAMKNLYNILRSRSITTGFVPMDNLEPWRDFLTAWGDYLAKNEKEKWYRDNFNPLTFFSQFNSIIAKLNNRPKTDAEKWIEWGKRQGL